MGYRSRLVSLARAAPLTACLLALLASLPLACGDKASDRPPPGAVCRPAPERGPGLWVAGSGTNLALTRALVERWTSRHREPRVVVPESIGTQGALRALRAGAIDIGLVSRPLTAAERGEGLVETRIAQVAFAPTVRADLAIESISSADLAQVFLGGRPPGWPVAVPIAPVMRELKDSGYVLAAQRLPDLGRALVAARRTERWPICFTDQEMRDTLLGLDGAIGLLDVATPLLERLPLKALAIDGVAATADNVAAGRFPLVRQLSFVTRGEPAGAARQFIAFAQGPQVVELFRAGELVRYEGQSEEGR
ncbi:MAG: substrate-binding domain-containing protein [Deltaproteobacteria bacterium]|nr:substrate-binding domain-containing protein [Deltaproteobacteria bacterium]